MRLLRQLINTLSRYIEAWESFRGYEGDLGYFADILEGKEHSSERARHSIETIKQAFGRLQQCKRELCDLEDLCKNSAQIVSQSARVLNTPFSRVCLLNTRTNRPSSNCR